MRHKIVQRQLYDYLDEQLPEHERKQIDLHVIGCTRCSKELDDMKKALQKFPKPSTKPADVRPAMYWQHFANRVERRIESEAAEIKTLSVNHILWNLFEGRKSFALGFASAVGMMVLLIFAWKMSGSGDSPGPDQTGTLAGTIRQASLESRTQDYLERSKILLIGFVNADPSAAGGSERSLNTQRRLSKDLLRESKELTDELNDPSQQRLKRLITDLELILIQISNLESGNNSPAIEIVRNGVERRNILLKINMEELQRLYKAKSGTALSKQSLPNS